MEELMEARLSVARNLLLGDYITVKGPGGWSDIPGKVIVQKVAPKTNGQGDLIDVTITVKKLNRNQELPSPCSGGYYFSAAKCTIEVFTQHDGAKMWCVFVRSQQKLPQWNSDKKESSFVLLTYLLTYLLSFFLSFIHSFILS